MNPILLATSLTALGLAALSVQTNSALGQEGGNCVSVKDHGAVAATAEVPKVDSAPAFQAAADDASKSHRSICIPAGIYYLSTGFSLDQSAATADTTPRPSILGAGTGTTRLVFGPGDFAGLSITGGTTGAGVHVYATVKGMRLEKAGGSGVGIKLNRTAYLSLEGITVLGWGQGLQGTDVLSTTIRDSNFNWNSYGLTFKRGIFSHPNAIAILNTRIGSNAENGIVAANPTLLSVSGGEIAGNGTTGTSATRGGIFIDGGPVEGGVGLIADHVYFEGNVGEADILIHGGKDPGAYTVRSSTFNRLSSNTFATNMIKARGEAVIKLDVSGNAFKRLGSYTPSSDRPYVDMRGAVNPESSLDFSRSNFMDDPSVEGPSPARGAGSTESRSPDRRAGRVSVREFDFNEGEYLRCNPDVAQAVTGGSIDSGAMHYETFGQREGRRINC